MKKEYLFIGGPAHGKKQVLSDSEVENGVNVPNKIKSPTWLGASLNDIPVFIETQTFRSTRKDLSMLTLSDLILKGGASKIQIFGALQNGENEVCALGAAIEGAKEAGLIKSGEEEDGQS